MPMKRYKPEQIVTMLRQIEVSIANGKYNTERPHSALGYRPPAPQAILPKKLGHGDVEKAHEATTERV